MRALWIILGIAAVVGTGGAGYYFIFAEREVERGRFQGFEWRVIKLPKGLGAGAEPDLFCSEIRRLNPVGFGAEEFAEFQKLDCKSTIGQAKGEAILAITNLIEDSEFLDESETPLGEIAPLGSLAPLLGDPVLPTPIVAEFVPFD